MKLPDLIGMYLDSYLIEPIGKFLNISENMIIFILIAISVVILGYVSKLYINTFNRDLYMNEIIQKFGNEQDLKEDSSFAEKTISWIEDGYGVELCNKMAVTIIIVGILWEIIETSLV